MSRSRLHFAMLVLAGVSGIGLSMTPAAHFVLTDRQDKSRTGSSPFGFSHQIIILDHVIIGGGTDKIFSFRGAGLMDQLRPRHRDWER